MHYIVLEIVNYNLLINEIIFDYYYSFKHDIREHG